MSGEHNKNSQKDNNPDAANVKSDKVDQVNAVKTGDSKKERTFDQPFDEQMNEDGAAESQ